MVHCDIKYKWSDRKAHFSVLNNQRRVRRAFEKELLRESKITDIFNDLSENGIALQLPAQTRFEVESGTTIPESIFLKVEKEP